MTIKVLLVRKTNDCTIYLEEETHLKQKNRFCTHAGKSVSNRFWGHYNMTYEDAVKDYTERIARGF